MLDEQVATATLEGSSATQESGTKPRNVNLITRFVPIL